MQAMVDLVRVLFDPAAVFSRVREKPALWQPFLGLAVVQMIIVALMLPYSKAAVRAMMAQQGAPAGGPDPTAFAALGIVFAPIGLAIVLLLAGFLLWVLVSLFGEEAKFSTLLSVAIYSSVPGVVLLGIAGVAVIMLRGPGEITSMIDLQPALGLDLLMPDAGPRLTAILKGFNPFSIWGLVLTAIGITTTHRVSKGAGYFIAGLVFVVGLLVGALFAGFGGGRGAGAGA